MTGLPRSLAARRAVKTLLLGADWLRGGGPAPFVILIYHSVGAGIPLELDVTIEAFEAQLRWLAAHADVVPLSDILANPQLEPRRGCCRVVLTFDDACKSVRSIAAPRLEAYGMPAIVYVPTFFVDRQEGFPWLRDVRVDHPDRAAPMSWGELGELRERGFTIGSHTHTHPRLDVISDAEIATELQLSRRRITEEVGVEPRHFCYPGGRYSDRDLRMVQAAFDSAVVGRGPVSVAFDPWRLSRLPVQQSDSLRTFTGAITRQARSYDAVLRLLGRA